MSHITALLGLLIACGTANGFVAAPGSDGAFCRGCRSQQSRLPSSRSISGGRGTTGLQVLPSDDAVRTQAEQDAHIRSLEEEYWKSLSPEEYTVARQQTIGLELMKQDQLDKAIEAYDKVLEVSQDTYLWQRGLVLYYLGRFREAAQQWDRDIHIFESKFESSATEERIYRASALLREAQDGASVPATDVAAQLEELPLKETNRLTRTVYEVFRETTAPEEVVEVMAKDERNFMGHKFFGNFYLALWHDTRGEEAEAKARLQLAQRTPAEAGDLWYHIPRIHAQTRGWQL